MTTENITYGIGGFDPEMPNDNKVEQTIDNGDGTGTHTDYTTDPPTVTNLTDLPIPEPVPSSPELVAAEAIQAEIEQRLAPADVNSIAEMKAAIRDGLTAAVESLR